MLYAVSFLLGVAFGAWFVAWRHHRDVQASEARREEAARCNIHGVEVKSGAWRVLHRNGKPGIKRPRMRRNKWIPKQ